MQPRHVGPAERESHLYYVIAAEALHPSLCASPFLCLPEFSTLSFLLLTLAVWACSALVTQLFIYPDASL